MMKKTGKMKRSVTRGRGSEEAVRKGGGKDAWRKAPKRTILKRKRSKEDPHWVDQGLSKAQGKREKEKQGEKKRHF